MPESAKIVLGPPRSVEERERFYYEKVLSQDFYGPGYVEKYEWDKDTESHVLKADVVNKYLGCKKVMDSGCSRGSFVHELRTRGIQAFGLDFSHAFVSSAPPDALPFLCSGDVARLPFRDRAFDLVVCSEVLEHLPISVIDRVLCEFKRVCKGCFFITTPSHGPNIEGRYGFKMHDVPEWIEDARLNRSFRHLPVYEDTGLPHCGHITLATHGWWRDKYAQHGLNRAVPLEVKINYDQQFPLLSWPYSIHVLFEVKDTEIRMGANDYKQLGTGWYDLENWEGEGGARWTKAEAACMLRVNSKQLRLYLEVFSGPLQRIYSTKVECIVDQIGSDPDVMAWEEKARFRLEVEPGRWQSMFGPKFETDAQKIIRIRLRPQETWKPPQILNSSFSGERSTDTRELGIAVKRIAALVQ